MMEKDEKESYIEIGNKKIDLNSEVLYLYNNQLSSLPESFGNLTNLTELYLYNNQLSSLLESFGNLTNLTKLDLSDNQLSSLPESFGNLTNLTKLSLYNNQLSSIPESFGNLTNLTRLGLRHNQLSSLPESFGNLTNLTKLRLHKNQLSSLPESFGNLTNLTQLYLYNNQLSSLLESFGNLTNLTKFHLRHNQLSSLPESFGNLTNLTQLGLRHNQLSSLPESFGNLTNLTRLYLSYNSLSSLPESFGNLTNLTKLGLHKNQLSSLLESFGNLTNLTILNLYNNQLSSLPESFGNLTNLTELDLSQNKIEYLPIEILTLKNLSKFDCVGNLQNFNISSLSSFRNFFVNILTTQFNGKDFSELLNISLEEFEIELQKIGNLIDKDIPILFKFILWNSIEEILSKYRTIFDEHSEKIENMIKNIKYVDIEKKLNIILSRNIKLEYERLNILTFCKMVHSTFVKYFEMNQNSKIIFIGKENVGKTTICKRILNNFDFSDKLKSIFGRFSWDSTDGIDLKRFQISPNNFLDLWDFGGQDLYYNTHKLFLTKKNTIVLVFRIDQELTNSNFLFWIENIALKSKQNNNNNENPIFLVGTYLDQISSKKRNQEILKKNQEIQELLKDLCLKFNFQKFQYKQEFINFFPISASSESKDFDNLISKIKFESLNCTKTIVTKQMNDILEGFKEFRVDFNNFPIIESQIFENWIKDYNFGNNTKFDFKFILKFLINIGEVIYFENFNLIILNLQFIFNVFKSLISYNTENYLKKGILKKSEISNILKTNFAKTKENDDFKFGESLEKTIDLFENLNLVFKHPHFENNKSYLFIDFLQHISKTVLNQNIWCPEKFQKSENKFERIYSIKYFSVTLIPIIFSKILEKSQNYQIWKYGIIFKIKDIPTLLKFETENSDNITKIYIQTNSEEIISFFHFILLDTISQNLPIILNFINCKIQIICENNVTLQLDYLNQFLDWQNSPNTEESKEFITIGDQSIHFLKIWPEWHPKYLFNEFNINQANQNNSFASKNEKRGATASSKTGSSEDLNLLEKLRNNQEFKNYKNFAIKNFKFDEIEEQYFKFEFLYNIRKEILFLSHLNHKNVINYLGFNQKPFSILTEKAENDNLFDFLEYFTFSIFQIQYLIFGIISGLKYLHQKNIIHSDLKSKNIVLFKIKNKNNLSKNNIIFEPKLIDFGDTEFINFEKCRITLENEISLFGILIQEILDKNLSNFFKNLDNLDQNQDSIVNLKFLEWQTDFGQQFIEDLETLSKNCKNFNLQSMDFILQEFLNISGFSLENNQNIRENSKQEKNENKNDFQFFLNIFEEQFSQKFQKMDNRLNQIENKVSKNEERIIQNEEKMIENEEKMIEKFQEIQNYFKILENIENNNILIDFESENCKIAYRTFLIKFEEIFIGYKALASGLILPATGSLSLAGSAIALCGKLIAMIPFLEPISGAIEDSVSIVDLLKKKYTGGATAIQTGLRMLEKKRKVNIAKKISKILGTQNEFSKLNELLAKKLVENFKEKLWDNLEIENIKDENKKIISKIKDKTESGISKLLTSENLSNIEIFSEYAILKILLNLQNNYEKYLKNQNEIKLEIKLWEIITTNSEPQSIKEKLISILPQKEYDLKNGTKIKVEDAFSN